jgi:hypothetical protein
MYPFSPNFGPVQPLHQLRAEQAYLDEDIARGNHRLVTSAQRLAEIEQHVEEWNQNENEAEAEKAAKCPPAARRRLQKEAVILRKSMGEKTQQMQALWLRRAALDAEIQTREYWVQTAYAGGIIQSPFLEATLRGYPASPISPMSLGSPVFQHFQYQPSAMSYFEVRHSEDIEQTPIPKPVHVEPAQEIRGNQAPEEVREAANLQDIDWVFDLTETDCQEASSPRNHARRRSLFLQSVMRTREKRLSSPL